MFSLDFVQFEVKRSCQQSFPLHESNLLVLFIRWNSHLTLFLCNCNTKMLTILKDAIKFGTGGPRYSRFWLFSGQKTGDSGKAMRSVNIIEYSIKNRVETNISRNYSSDYHTIFSAYLNMSKMSVFCRNSNNTEIFSRKSSFFGLWKCTFWG